ncbi:MAG: serine/threonine protein kinase [Fimbriiglobus sp.]
MNRQIGNYDLISKIAEGGMGAVYKGRSRASGEIVAIKIVPAETAKNPLLLKRFEQEFKAASLIDHPNVVKAIDYCGTSTTPFLVMEFVDGESLGAKIERDGALDEDEAIRIIGQVCEGLHRAHKQGLIHRDVKPDNILLTQEMNAKVTDLGLVKDVEGEMNLTKTGRGLGTPHFMAPEQFRNAKNADVRCDVYSLAATLYTMVTGEIPFDKTSPLDCWLKKTKNDFPSPKARRKSLSDRTDWAIRRAMHSDPAQRPASCREFMEDLLGSAWRSQSSGFSPAPPMSTEPPPLIPGAPDIWYMVYRDASNQMHTVKGATESIRKNLTNGALGDVNTILVSRTKNGTFLPLKSVPEFRDIALTNEHVMDPTVQQPSLGSIPEILQKRGDSKETVSGVKTVSNPSRPSQPPTKSPLVEKPKSVTPSQKTPHPPRVQPTPVVQESSPNKIFLQFLPFILLGFVLAIILLAFVYVLTK